MEKSLTQAIIDYQKSGTGLKPLMDEVALRVYYYPPMRRQWEEDECGDFLCYFYPRINRMIQRFEDRGKPFEALLAVALKWQMRGYAYTRHKKRQKEKILTHTELWELPERSSPEDFVLEGPVQTPAGLKKALKIDDSGVITEPGIRRRILYLLLREVHQVSEPLLVHVALLTGYDISWLEEKLEEARNLTLQRVARKQMFRHRRCLALFNLYCLHEEIRECVEGEERTVLLDRIQRETERLNRAEEGIRRVPRGPSHREIANILGLPKGTVDSGLYYLSRSLGGTAGSPDAS